MGTPQENEKEQKARSAIHDLGLEIADRWASGFEKRPTQQLVLQKILDPIVRHVLNSIFPWIVGVAVLFLILLICTVVTCVIVLRSGPVVASAAVAYAPMAKIH
jgi:hypothetical protein